MRRIAGLFIILILIAVGFVAGLLLEKTIASVQAQHKSRLSAPAIAGEKNTQDLWGPYEVVTAPNPSPRSQAMRNGPRAQSRVFLRRRRL